MTINCFDGKYAFLSNFYSCPVTYEGVHYENSEAAFQAAKCCNKNDRLQFCGLNPSQAKKLGRKIKLRPDWEKVKVLEMRKIVREKFIQNPDLKKALVSTGKATLIEGNYWHDNTWGNCTCEKCKNIPGKNYLGTILEDVRTEFSQENH